MVIFVVFVFFFFFKQKTAYEMRISDWSSDVCSSDLQQRQRHAGVGGMQQRALPFDDVPVVGAGVGGQRFRGARGEVADHRVQRDAASGDQDAGLAGGAEIDVDAAPFECPRSEEHTSELQSLMRISYAVFCLKKKTIQHETT